MFDENKLSGLRERIEDSMSAKRFFHTACVEKMAARLAEFYIPEKISTLRAAALLHDITKEYPTEKHLEILKAHGINVSKEDILTPKTLHGRTAALLIPEVFPEFATEDVVRSVRYHTTGRANMSICEKIVYLADYIDESRTFEDCVMLREMFWSAEPEKMSMEERLRHLDRVLVKSFDITISGLLEKGAIVSEDTFAARNWLLMQ